MAGERAGHGPERYGGLRRRAVLPALAALLLPSAACTAPAPARTPATTAGTATDAVRLLLARRAAAVLDRDEAAYLAVLDPRADTLRATARAEFAHLAELPLRSWDYHLTGVRRTGARATVHAELRYRITGYDTAPVATPRALTLAEHDGRWYVSADRPGAGGTEQLWQQGRVRAVRGARSLVLGVGQDERTLRRIADTADLAVPAVDRAWPDPWARRVLLLVPASRQAMAALLGAAGDGYRSIAAVTTGETGGTGPTPADRIIVNPEAYGELSDLGRRVVLTHETTHVATRAATSPATPTWLSEGYADHIAYRGTGLTAARIAPELRRAVRRDKAPTALPPDTDFAFTGDADRLARAYESGWLACELIADRWGERSLTDFYRAVGGHTGRAGAVARAARDILGTTEADLTARWRDSVRQRLG
ncbi:hypothetical protein [Streptomyces paludis]|uniref:Uncharacterized protein n=1 Tax=Streptomyces paludis TaxID=2282738 RepID=A0A345HL43_9ACTN|nr:hypothetical protein [Streptomyces paludis]AXG77417.1 hypothetical protein DVK44_06605 [Streptomyces paludis]